MLAADLRGALDLTKAASKAAGAGFTPDPRYPGRKVREARPGELRRHIQKGLMLGESSAQFSEDSLAAAGIEFIAPWGRTR